MEKTGRLLLLYQPSRILFCLAWLGLAPLVSAEAARAASPLQRAHAHNDYEHARPLLDALDQGFCSVEADVYLVEGKLLVAHNRNQVRPERTLERLYLDPLRERVQANHGHVYPELATNSVSSNAESSGVSRTEFTLLVDIKRDGAAVYAVLRKMLAEHADMFTQFTPTSTVPRAVTVILSGDRPADLVAAEPLRLCALDGRIGDLDRNPSPYLYPLISDNWASVFGAGSVFRRTEADRVRLVKLVRKAHAQGRRLRFWGAPDSRVIWREFYESGVDLIGTDDLPSLGEFLRTRPGPLR